MLIVVRSLSSLSFAFYSTRWRSISNLRCPSCRVLSPNWRRRRTERSRNFRESTRTLSDILLHLWDDDTLKTPLLSPCTCRYTYLRCMIEEQLGCLPEGPTCRWSVLQKHTENNQENPSNYSAPHIFQSHIQNHMRGVSLCMPVVPSNVPSPIVFCFSLHCRSQQKKWLQAIGAERA